MSENALRYAAPTAQKPSREGYSSEGVAAPHGEHWTRQLPPLDFKSYNAPSAADVVADSVARHTDSNGDGSGTGRRASGFLMVTAGTLTLHTGAGQDESFQGQTLPADFGFACEFTSVTSSGIVVVYW